MTMINFVIHAWTIQYMYYVIEPYINLADLITGNYNIINIQLTHKKEILRWCFQTSYYPTNMEGQWREHGGWYIYPLPELTGRQQIEIADLRKFIVKEMLRYAIINIYCLVKYEFYPSTTATTIPP